MSNVQNVYSSTASLESMIFTTEFFLDSAKFRSFTVYRLPSAESIYSRAKIYTETIFILTIFIHTYTANRLIESIDKFIQNERKYSPKYLFYLLIQKIKTLY